MKDVFMDKENSIDGIYVWRCIHMVFINIFDDLHVHDNEGCVPSWTTSFIPYLGFF
jgi:hypothetical protein